MKVSDEYRFIRIFGRDGNADHQVLDLPVVDIYLFEEAIS